MCVLYKMQRELIGFGNYSVVETPLTIPNREVKHISADGTTNVEE